MGKVSRKMMEKEICKVIDSVCDVYKAKLSNELDFHHLIDVIDADVRRECKLAVAVRGK